MEVKYCHRCDTTKPLSEFWVDRSRKDGLQTRCKDCGKAIQAKFKRENPERVSEVKRAWYARNGDYRREEHYKYHYGITRAQRDEMLERQGGVCAICGKRDQKWHVDHDHACCPTGKTCGKCIRGILCQHCNKALGLFRDDPTVLEKAAEYLKGGEA